MNQTVRQFGDNIPLAIGAILFMVFTLALGDALIKGISADFTLWQIFVVRSGLYPPILISPQRFAA